jgi:hypothetical protein
MDITLKAFLVCKDVLYNSRDQSVISIINVFNQLQVSQYPANIDTICIVAIYGGAPGEYRHHLEIWERDVQIGDTAESTFFLEDRNAFFHAASYLDGILVNEPRHLIFKAVLNGEVKGETSLGIFKPLRFPENKTGE